jgi:hypothetical protein
VRIGPAEARRHLVERPVEEQQREPRERRRARVRLERAGAERVGHLERGDEVVAVRAVAVGGAESLERGVAQRAVAQA